MAKKKSLETIAEILPEGLDESILEQIAELVSVKIKEEVKEKISELTDKVRAFIRGNVEKLKEQAIKELELENDTFRNAQMFETVKSMFVLENTSEDELNGITALASIGEEQEKKNEALVEQVEKLLKENVQLKRSLKLSTDKTLKLEESIRELSESANTDPDFSDSAKVISKENFEKVPASINKLEENDNHAVYGNEWINKGVLDNFSKLKKVR